MNLLDVFTVKCKSLVSLDSFSVLDLLCCCLMSYCRKDMVLVLGKCLMVSFLIGVVVSGNLTVE